MKEIVDNIASWLRTSNDTNGNVILTAVIVAIVVGALSFWGGGWKEKRKLKKSEEAVRSLKVSEVFSFNVQSSRSNSNMRKVTLRITNSSNQNRKFELISVLKDAGDPNDPMRRALVDSFSDVIEIPANDGEEVEIGKIFSPMGGPGRIICEFQVKPLDWGEIFEDEKEVRHI